MNDDNVRHLWSDAELDEALDALHPHVRTDPAELDRARATLLRAAAAESGRSVTGPPAKKKRGGSWRWIAVAAAVAVVTGGVVVAREVAERPATVAPAATPTADTRLGPGQYTHVTNAYTDIEWASDRTAFAVPQTVEFWIPADRSGVWKRTWTRGDDAVIITGLAGDKASLPGPASTTQTAAGGRFTESFPHPGGWNVDIDPSWYRPTPQFIASLPTDPAALETRLAHDSEPPSMSLRREQLLPPMLSYPGLFQHAPDAATTKDALPPAAGSPAAAYAAPGDFQVRLLSVLASGLTPRPLRATVIKLLRNAATQRATKGDIEIYTVDYGNHELLTSVNTATDELVSTANVTTGNFYGIGAGRALSSSHFDYEVTDDFGS